MQKHYLYYYNHFIQSMSVQSRMLREYILLDYIYFRSVSVYLYNL